MATTTTSSLLRELSSDCWRRLVFMYVGPGKRRQWAPRLGSPGRRPPQAVTVAAGFVSVLLSVLVFYLIARISTFGVFWVAGEWGGQTLVGDWIVYTSIAAPIVAAAMWLLVPVTNLVIRGLR